MEKHEVIEFLEHVAQFARVTVTHAVVDAWFGAFGERYTLAQLMKAFERIQLRTDKAPSIYSMQDELNAMLGRNYGLQGRTRADLSVLPTRIEVCIDKLGLETVNQELAQIVGQPFRWSELIQSPKKRQAYRQKVSELFEMCRHYHGVSADSVRDSEAA